MRRLLDLLYLLIAAVTSPIWLLRMVQTGKIRTDWRGRFGAAEQLPRRSGVRRIMIHAVSVGEINAIRLLVDQLRTDEPDADIVISTTTDTGFARAMTLFGKQCPVVRYPFDFSFAVDRLLKAVQPDAVVLVELEVWPNFCAACAKREIPVCIVNGRLTDRSFKRYRWVKPVIDRWFAALRFACVQNADYAARFQAMGVAPDRLHVTGTMKWDTAEIADDVPGAAELAQAMGIDRSKPLIVAGSTAPGEHELLVQALPQGVQLLCAPRRPEWFDQAALAMPGCARRTLNQHGSNTGRFLLDTIGELRQAYALADIVVVGRSFGSLHGSDMMEPVALGKPTVVGPAVADFRETTDSLLDGGGLIQCDASSLSTVLQSLLNDEAKRRQLAENGRNVIRANQGATSRHSDMILQLLPCAQEIRRFSGQAETAKEKKEERTM